MERGKILTLEQRPGNSRKNDGGTGGAVRSKPLPDPDNLWELLDRNISIDVWKQER